MVSGKRLIPVVLLFAVLAAAAQTSSVPAATPVVEPGHTAAQPFDVKAAVDAYLAKMPPAQRARSDAYFEGGYWLQLWDFLATMAVMWFLLSFGWSTRMRNLAQRITRFSPLQTAVYAVQFIVALTVLTFPLAIYEGYLREHKYGLSNQTFGPWLVEQGKFLVINTVLFAILMMALFWVVRRLGKSWWIWGAGVTIALSMLLYLIAPVFLFPWINHYTKLEDARFRDPILSMARANGIPAKEVYEFDASKQSKRVSANVSGFAGTMRISLNDNLLNRCTLAEIQPVMGHEMGHYVLNHVYKGVVMRGILYVIGFAFLNWALLASLARWGEKWGIREITDVAVVPLAIAILSVYFFVTTPVDNTITRTMEFEADMYGINASLQPDGEANVDLMLGEYRKLDPGPVEEFLFYDHPSGRTRITAAMRWKAEHPGSANPEEAAKQVFTSQ